MPVKLGPFFLLCLACLVITNGCTGQAQAVPMKMAIIAPFEGRYRDVGYDVLYAARLAVQDSGSTNIELLPVEDGDNPALAADRAAALVSDAQVFGALIIGYAAVDTNTQAALSDIPTIVVGDWGAAPVGDEVYLMSHGNLGLPDDSFLFAAVRVLFPEYANSAFISAAAPPDADFSQRIAALDEFAPAPSPLSTLTYDAMRVLLQSAANKTSRAETAAALQTIDYQGLTGRVRFLAHSWINPPSYSYQLMNGELLVP